MNNFAILMLKKKIIYEFVYLFRKLYVGGNLKKQRQ